MAVNDRRLVGKDRGGALKEGERGQRLEIRRPTVEVGIVGRFAMAPILAQVWRNEATHIDQSAV